MSFIIDYEQGAKWTNQRTTTTHDCEDETIYIKQFNNLTLPMRCKNLHFDSIYQKYTKMLKTENVHYEIAKLWDLIRGNNHFSSEYKHWQLIKCKSQNHQISVK